MSDIESKIKQLESVSPEMHPSKIFCALEDAIQVIKELKDEANSAWDLLEELRSSEISAHAESLKKELDKKIIETLALAGSKVVLA